MTRLWGRLSALSEHRLRLPFAVVVCTLFVDHWEMWAQDIRAALDLYLGWVVGNPSRGSLMNRKGFDRIPGVRGQTATAAIG